MAPPVPPPSPAAAAPAPLNEAERRAVLAIAAALAPLEPVDFDPVLRTITVRCLRRGDALLRAGEPGAREFFVLDGVLRTWISDAQGRSVTLAFHEGPGILMPAISRTAGDRSRVHCEALSAARVAGFDPATLVDCMTRSPVVQRWGDAVLRAELLRRVEREWALAALPAAQRVAQFRQQHPGLEARVAQHHIANYLGITAVSLSRLRAQERVGLQGRQAAGRAT